MEGRYDKGSICILNLYRNITHNCLIKRGLGYKNCREPNQILITTTLKTLKWGFFASRKGY
jgi:hypothetical protein